MSSSALEYVERATKDYATLQSRNSLQYTTRTGSALSVANGSKGYKYGGRIARYMAVGQQPQVAGTSFSFTGQGAIVIPSMDFTASKSISVWIRVNPLQTDEAGILSDNTGQDFAQVIDADSAPWNIRIREGGTTGAQTGSSYLNDTWYNLIMTRDSDPVSGGSVYVNGVLAASGNVDYNDWSVTHIGVRGPGLLGQFYGHITHLSYIDKDLSVGEALEMYNGGVPPDLTAVTFAADVTNWYKLGEGDTFFQVFDSLTSNVGTVGTGISPSSVYPT